MKLLYNYIPKSYAELFDKIFECNLLDVKYPMLQMLFDKVKKDKKVNKKNKDRIYNLYTGYFDSIGLIMDDEEGSYHTLTDTLVYIKDINDININDALMTINEMFMYCKVESIDYIKLYATIDLVFEGFDKKHSIGRDITVPSPDANLVIKLIGAMIENNDKHYDTNRDEWIYGIWSIICFCKNFIDIYETGARLGNDSLLNIFALRNLRDLVDQFLQERVYPTASIVSIIN